MAGWMPNLGARKWPQISSQACALSVSPWRLQAGRKPSAKQVENGTLHFNDHYGMGQLTGTDSLSAHYRNEPGGAHANPTGLQSIGTCFFWLPDPQSCSAA